MGILSGARRRVSSTACTNGSTPDGALHRLRRGILSSAVRAYAAWLLVTRGSIRNLEDWQIRTIAYLAIAGSGLLLVAIFAFISLNSAEPGAVYVPAHIENGEIVPGHFE